MKNIDYTDWIRFADDDIASAQFMLKHEKPAVHVVFLCHQSIEKYLKALILYQGKDFSYTHHLTALTSQCAVKKNDEIALLNACIVLDELYPFARYPSKDAAINTGDASNALTAAERAKKIVMGILHVSV